MNLIYIGGAHTGQCCTSARRPNSTKPGKVPPGNSPVKCAGGSVSGSHTPYSLDAALATDRRGREVEKLGTAVLAPRDAPRIICVMAAIPAIKHPSFLSKYATQRRWVASCAKEIGTKICQFRGVPAEFRGNKVDVIWQVTHVTGPFN